MTQQHQIILLTEEEREKRKRGDHFHKIYPWGWGRIGIIEKEKGRKGRLMIFPQWEYLT